MRDYIHVTDLAQAHILAAKYLIEGGKSDIFNLGSGVGFTNMEIIDAARRVTGHELPVLVQGRRPGDPAQLIASSQKARDILHWNPQHENLDEIIGSAWKWHEGHPDGFAQD